ncbi:MAG TPA: hypothetical protein VMB03_00020 [Bryobacteraceae bacterium]|nr:hypothetical protein [Bryobacteraceae bacterium]
MNGRVLGLALACAIAPNWLAAEVVDSAPNGFTVKQTIDIQAPPHDVYAKIFRVGDWWNPAHTFSHDAHNLSLEEKAGGCFCEKLPGGGAVKHMEVVYFVPGKTILLRGAMGPFQSMATITSLQMQLSAANGGTRLEVTWTSGGYLAAGLNSLAAVVDGVTKDQFTRLKNAIEKGNPEGK